MRLMKLLSLPFIFFCLSILTGCVATGTSPMTGSAANPALATGDLSPFPALTPEQMEALPPVKVGLLLPLSGAHAGLGQAMLQSAQMALFDMGYAKFELVPRDTAGGAGQAAKAVIADGASLILGPVFAADVRAAQPIAAAANINMIVFSTDWSVAGGNVFAMGFLPFDQVERVSAHAAGQGMTPLGVFAPVGAYGNAVVSSFEKVTGRRGIETVPSRRSSLDDAALRQAARQFFHIPRNPSGVLVPAGGNDAIRIVSALRQNGLPDAQILGTGLFDDPALAASGALEGAWFAGPDPQPRAGFEQRFRQTYGGEAPRLATLSYDATALAAVLAQRGFARSGQPAFDRDSITNPNGFSGLDGIFRFRADGLAERGLAILGFRQRRIIVLEPAPQTFQSLAY